MLTDFRLKKIMNIKPIKTRRDYKEALGRIEALMGAKKNTTEGDELDVLATLVDAYEAKNFVIDDPETDIIL